MLLNNKYTYCLLNGGGYVMIINKNLETSLEGDYTKDCLRKNNYSEDFIRKHTLEIIKEKRNTVEELIKNNCTKDYINGFSSDIILSIAKIILEAEEKSKNSVIYTEDTFNFSTAKVGDLVEEKVVENFMNLLPPVSMTRECSQLGEPYNHIEDENGKFKPVYATFKRLKQDVWIYCGYCFRGQNIEPNTLK